MKTTWALLIAVLFELLFSAACQGGGPFTGPHCVEGTCVRLEAAPQAGGAGTTVPVTVIVESQVEVEELRITLSGEADVVGERQWTVHVLPNQPVTLSSAIRPRGEGLVHAMAAITWGKGRRTQYEIALQVTKDGITPNPTILPPNIIVLPSGATRVLPVPPPQGWTPNLSDLTPAIAVTPIMPPSVPDPRSMPTSPPAGGKPTSPPTKVRIGGTAVPTTVTPQIATPTPKPYP
jgi:hypothetical protein